MNARIPVLMALALAALPGSAAALCYTVFGEKQEVIYRGTNTPVDLSRPIHEGMRKAFPPGAILVIDDNDDKCTPIGPQAVFGSMPGFSGPTPGQPNWQSGMVAGPREAAQRQ